LRARGAGVPFDGTPGELNAITDVPGVAVGYCTLIRGDGALVVGEGPVRTGVTAILPRGREHAGEGVFAGYFAFNGDGEMSGAAWIQEAGRCEGPITITNTNSCGTARDATLRWLQQRVPHVLKRPRRFVFPVAAETFDGHLNDINGFHVKDEHVFAALDAARGGRIDEGSIGGGTGMRCFEFKGGTASRRVELDGQRFHVGALVQSNFGMRHQCTIAGVPVGRHIPLVRPQSDDSGSIIVIVATDAPLLPHQLERVARRCASGIARCGGIPSNASGDLCLAFSTGNSDVYDAMDHVAHARFVPDFLLSPVFEATVESVEEAIVNSMVGNPTMTGIDGFTVQGLPTEVLRELLARYGRLADG
jgi:L-aminopeptidase/D-esterase-like protein